MEAGVYFFRVSALNVAGDELGQQEPRDPDRPEGKRTTAGDDVLLGEIGDDGPIAPAASIKVAGFAEAELRAGWSARSTTRPQAKRKWFTKSGSRVQVASAGIRFDSQREYVVEVGQELRLLEADLLGSPEDGGCRRLRLGGASVSRESQPLVLPEEVRRTRTHLFELIRSVEVEIEEDGDSGGPGTIIVALADPGLDCAPDRGICRGLSRMARVRRSRRSQTGRDSSGNPRCAGRRPRRTDAPAARPLATPGAGARKAMARRSVGSGSASTGPS